MPTPYASAQLNLQLFDRRRDGFWDMAASPATPSADFRAARSEPDFCQQVQAVVLAMADGQTIRAAVQGCAAG